MKSCWSEASSILSKCGINVENYAIAPNNSSSDSPGVSSGSSVYLAQPDTHLDRAEAYRKEFSDEFISIEHLLLAYIKDDRFGKSLFKNLA